MQNDSIINKRFPQHCGDILIVLERTTLYKRTAVLYKVAFENYFCEILARKEDIIAGKVMNPLYPSSCNIGYLGIGEFNSKDKSYCIWNALIQRCYNKNNPYYKKYGKLEIKICEDWFNFQNFAKWYKEKIDLYKEHYKLSLDKDILSNINHLDNKLYSPNTCLLIPEDINSWLMGDNMLSGIRRRCNNFEVRVKFNKIEKSLGTYKYFEDAKNIYSKEKYKNWQEYLNKFNLDKSLLNILLQYDFSWNWKIKKLTNEEIIQKYF